MDTSIRAIEQILSGDTKYIIPAYQRPYRWTKDNVEELLFDIWGSFQNNDSEYFLGSVICCVTEKDGKKTHEIVDGQQRLITITLIMLQLGKQIENIDIKHDLRRRIFPRNAYDNAQTEEPTLTVLKRERAVYKKLLNEEEILGDMTKDEKKFVENENKIREFFRKTLEGDQESLQNFVTHLIRKVQVLEVLSNDRLSSFRLFKVLNHRGMPLAYTDLLKNELIGKAYVDGGERLEQEVEQQWGNLKNVVDDIDLGKEDDKSDDGKSMELFFATLQVSEKIDRNRVRVDIYKHFGEQLMGKMGKDKDEKSKYDGNSVKMIGEILESAHRFQDVCKGESSKKVMSFLRGFSKNTKEWAPAIMVFLNNKNYDMNQFAEFAKLLEKVYVQKWFIGGTASKREEPSYYAVQAINAGKSVDEVMAILRAFADNDAVNSALDNDDFYDSGFPARVNFIKWVLLRLSAEMGERDVHTEHTGKITIEHILPEKMGDSSYWTEYFKEEDHYKWLHKIGNLTIIGQQKNSSVGNKDFQEKRDQYKNSTFAITRKIHENYEEWQMAQLQDRHDEMKKMIGDLWLVK